MAEEDQQTKLTYQGQLRGHSNWVTCIAAGHSQKENEDSPVLISGSRDKSLIIWKLYEEEGEDGKYGQPHRQLTGHGHFISDLALSQENCYAVSSSWDKTLRLWDLRAGKTSRKFQNGHTKEVFTVAFSPCNRQILSAGADRKVILWNTLAQKKYESDALNHTDWVSCIRYSPVAKSNKGEAPYFASVGWDGRLKIWNTNIQVKNTFRADNANINGVSISPHGKFIATGGKDKKLTIWDIKDLSRPLSEYDAGSTIFQIAFNPKLQWVAAGTEQGVKVWNLIGNEQQGSDKNQAIAFLRGEVKEDEKDKKKTIKHPMCVSLTWNALGRKLFAGFTDGNIGVWHVASDQK